MSPPLTNSARTGGEYFWVRTPAPILTGAATLALSLSTALALAWPEQDSDGVQVLGLAHRAPAGTTFNFILLTGFTLQPFTPFTFAHFRFSPALHLILSSAFILSI